MTHVAQHSKVPLKPDLVPITNEFDTFDLEGNYTLLCNFLNHFKFSINVGIPKNKCDLNPWVSIDVGHPCVCIPYVI